MTFLGLDPHQDSPVDALHTVALSQFRYLWFLTTSKWNKAKDQKFIAWLNGSNIDGLPGVPRGVQAYYLIDYHNNLVGKHFKWILQLMTFNIHWGGCDPTVFDLWRATGELGALVWCTKILDMGQYMVGLTVSMAEPRVISQPLAAGRSQCCGRQRPRCLGKSQPKLHYCQTETSRSHTPARGCLLVRSACSIRGGGI